MLYTKMNAIIDELSQIIAERDELIECIAIALLSKKNLFILLFLLLSLFHTAFCRAAFARHRHTQHKI